MSDQTITFTPNLICHDAAANYWMRQVTIRLRREVGWQWYERSKTPEAGKTDYTSLIEKAYSTLDMTRYWNEKKKYFETDTTAQYLSQLLKEPYPDREIVPVQGSFSWVVDKLKLDNPASFCLASGLIVTFDNSVGNIISLCLNDMSKYFPNLALIQKLWDYPEEILLLSQPTHPLFSRGLLQYITHYQNPQPVIDWESVMAVPTLPASQLLFPELSIPSVLYPLSSYPNNDGEVRVNNINYIASVINSKKEEKLNIIPVLGNKGSNFIETLHLFSRLTKKEIVEIKADPVLLLNENYVNALACYCWLRGVDVFINNEIISSLIDNRQRSIADVLPRQSIPVNIFLGITEQTQLNGIPGHLIVPAIEVQGFNYNERFEYWKRELGILSDNKDSILSECSRRFRFEKETIRNITEGLKAMNETLTGNILIEACRSEIEQNLGHLAQRVAPRFQDENLILPHKQSLQFEEIIQAMNSLTKVHYQWGTAKVWNESGISVLFSGPPGSGKTMAAEILAIKLDLPLYRIDLSQVVNKYIGETEKNLKKLFDAADISDTILFFDEADSLFGKRTEVRDSHDRYANLEISYLLDRMERFKGLAILASNRKKDIDEAFLRRLRYIIDFPVPEAAQRKKIWKQVIPKAIYNIVRFNLELKFIDQLRTNKLTEEFFKVFLQNNIKLSGNIQIVKQSKENLWILFDKDNDRGFLISEENDFLTVTPESGINFEFLAKQFPVTGGNIRSIVFNACLQSANVKADFQEIGFPLRMEKLIIAVKREYDKMNRSISTEHFGSYADIIKKIEREDESS